MIETAAEPPGTADSIGQDDSNQSVCQRSHWTRSRFGGWRRDVWRPFLTGLRVSAGNVSTSAASMHQPLTTNRLRLWCCPRRSGNGRQSRCDRAAVSAATAHSFDALQTGRALVRARSPRTERRRVGDWRDGRPRWVFRRCRRGPCPSARISLQPPRCQRPL
jgi:hypothetical protein